MHKMQFKKAPFKVNDIDYILESSDHKDAFEDMDGVITLSRDALCEVIAPWAELPIATYESLKEHVKNIKVFDQDGKEYRIRIESMFIRLSISMILTKIHRSPIRMKFVPFTEDPIV